MLAIREGEGEGLTDRQSSMMFPTVKLPCKNDLWCSSVRVLSLCIFYNDLLCHFLHGPFGTLVSDKLMHPILLGEFDREGNLAHHQHLPPGPAGTR